MNQRVELREAFRLPEYARRKHAPVDPVIAVENVAAKFFDHCLVGLALRFKHPMSDVVGLDHQAPQISERVANEALPTRETACESYAQHLSIFYLSFVGQAI